VFALTLPLGLP